MRQALGLSQQQLAGKEMTRVFISLVESGKNTPSPENLRTIAHRLGKPVDYFLQDKADDEALNGAIVQMERARQALERGTAEDLAVSCETLQQVLKQIAGQERADLEGQCRYLLGQCVRKTGRYEECLRECEQAARCYTALGDRTALAQVYLEMGTAAYHLEDFPTARRAYEKAALYASGLKSMQDVLVEALTVQASCLFRLGEYQEAVLRYQEAMAECPPAESPGRWGKIALGLGWTFYRMGDVDAARHWTQEAVKALTKSKSPAQVWAEQNLAIVEAERGNWESAYVILQRCLEAYKARGAPAHQAAVLEELARYWLHKGDLAQAEAACWRGIDLLDVSDDTTMRGRLYRFLGQLAARQGNLKEARSLLQISFDLLRRLKTTAEAAISLNELERVREMTRDPGE